MNMPQKGIISPKTGTGGNLRYKKHVSEEMLNSLGQTEPIKKRSDWLLLYREYPQHIFEVSCLFIGKKSFGKYTSCVLICSKNIFQAIQPFHLMKKDHFGAFWREI